MSAVRFLTASGIEIPSVTEAQMRLVDQIAVDDFGLGEATLFTNKRYS